MFVAAHQKPKCLCFICVSHTFKTLTHRKLLLLCVALIVLNDTWNWNGWQSLHRATKDKKEEEEWCFKKIRQNNRHSSLGISCKESHSLFCTVLDTNNRNFHCFPHFSVLLCVILFFFFLSSWVNQLTPALFSFCRPRYSKSLFNSVCSTLSHICIHFNAFMNAHVENENSLSPQRRLMCLDPIWAQFKASSAGPFCSLSCSGKWLAEWR